MTETTVLAAYGLLLVLTIVLQLLSSMQQLPLSYLLGARDEQRPVTGMAARLGRTLDNSVIAMALFAPAVLLVVHLERTTATTLLAVQVFLAARVIFVVAYAFAIPLLRTLSWAIGVAATVTLYLLAL